MKVVLRPNYCRGQALKYTKNPKLLDEGPLQCTVIGIAELDIFLISSWHLTTVNLILGEFVDAMLTYNSNYQNC